MNLFALTSNPAARVLRFPLSHDLQREVGSVLRAQRDAFLHGIVEVIDFDGRYRPDDGELLIIRNFVDVDSLASIVQNPIAVDQFDPAIHSMDSVKAIFSGCPDGGSQVLVQLFEQRRIISKGFSIFFSGNTFQKFSDAGLMLDTKLLAILDGGDLKFQSFHYLRRVFEVEEYFKEATSDEVQAFASHAKLATPNVAAFEAAANSTVRRKIGLILQSGVLDRNSVEQLAAEATRFKVDVKTRDGQIVLPESPSELRRLLRFLDEDYYESVLTQTQYVTNSKRVAD